MRAYYYHDQRDWSAEEISMLEILWEKNLPAREIGERLGRTKSSVIGKSRALNLPERNIKTGPPKGYKPFRPKKPNPLESR